jgi:hypothetical protein
MWVAMRPTTMNTISATDLSDVTGGTTMPSGESDVECAAHTGSMAALTGALASFGQWALRKGKRNVYVTAAATTGGAAYGGYRFCVQQPFTSGK